MICHTHAAHLPAVQARAVGPNGVPAPPLVCGLEGSRSLLDDLAGEESAGAPLLGLGGLPRAESGCRSESRGECGLLSAQEFLRAWPSLDLEWSVG